MLSLFIVNKSLTLTIEGIIGFSHNEWPNNYVFTSVVDLVEVHYMLCPTGSSRI